jgi:hypothetical protein
MLRFFSIIVFLIFAGFLFHYEPSVAHWVSQSSDNLGFFAVAVLIGIGLIVNSSMDEQRVVTVREEPKPEEEPEEEEEEEEQEEEEEEEEECRECELCDEELQKWETGCLCAKCQQQMDHFYHRSHYPPVGTVYAKDWCELCEEELQQWDHNGLCSSCKAKVSHYRTETGLETAPKCLRSTTT